MGSSFSGAIDRAGTVASISEATKVGYGKIYNQHCHRIYSLAFWMTDNELLANDVASNTFLRAFAGAGRPQAEQIDEALLIELREYTTLGTLTLNTPVPCETGKLHRNIKRDDLERAVVQLPPTEKLIFLLHDVEGYGHERIGHLLGLPVNECQFALHQARVCLRQMLTTI